MRSRSVCHRRHLVARDVEHHRRAPEGRDGRGSCRSGSEPSWMPRELCERGARVEQRPRRRPRRARRPRRRCAARSPRRGSDASMRSRGAGSRSCASAEVDESRPRQQVHVSVPAVDEVHVADARRRRAAYGTTGPTHTRRCCVRPRRAQLVQRADERGRPAPRPMRSGRDRDRAEEPGSVDLERAERADARRRPRTSTRLPLSSARSTSARQFAQCVAIHAVDLVAIGRGRERVAARVVGRSPRGRSSCRSWSRRAW